MNRLGGRPEKASNVYEGATEWLDAMPDEVSVGPVVRPIAKSEVRVLSYPIQSSLGILGREWALTLLRDIAFYESMRFSDILRNSSGITSRLLSMRLSDLSGAGFIHRCAPGGRNATYILTGKGKNTIPILAALTSFGIPYHADVVIPDEQATSPATVPVTNP